MKLTRIFICAGFGIAFALSGAPPRAFAADEPERDVHRIVSLLDYIAGDYRLAVKDGRVLSQAEYDEQKSFAANVRTLWSGVKHPRAESVRARVNAALGDIARAIERVAPPDEVAARCKTTRDDIVSALQVTLVPSRAPDRKRGRAVFAEACASCHGATGLGDGPGAAALRPAPASLHDALRMESMTALRVFNAMRFGVQGTSMPSFEASWSEADRWSVAFHVLALRHDAAAARAGAPPDVPRFPIAALALASDRDLRARLAEKGVAAADFDSALARTRTKHSFEAATHERTFEHGRGLVAAAIRSLEAGDRAAAERHALDAYLEGIEPIEPPLRARDSSVVERLERAATALRAAVSRGDVVAARAGAVELRAALTRAETLLTERRGTSGVAFIGSFLILFREGLEAALLIGALLGLLARLGDRRAGRYVHYGWMAALLLGAATYLVAHGLLQIGAAERELMEGVLNLFAALVLFYVSFWLLSKSDVARWMAFLKSKLEASVGRPRGLLAIAGLAFLAVYREALETVLFYQALLLDARGQGAAVALGAAVGALALVVAVWLIFRLGKRLPLTAFFLGSGALLCLLAAVMGGKGIHGLQEAGVLPLVPVAGPRVDWLGMYGDAIGYAVQAAIVVLLVAAAIVTVMRRRPRSPRLAA
jgi:high-affinity iron transporter